MEAVVVVVLVVPIVLPTTKQLNTQVRNRIIFFSSADSY